MTEGLFGHAVHGARWMGISKVLTTTIAWMSTIYVMRILQPSDYGVVAMGGLLTVLTSMLLDAGLGAAFVQRQDVTDDVYKSANLVLLGGALSAVLLIHLLAAPLARFFAEPVLAPVLRVSSIQFVLGAMIVVPGAILTKQMRFKALGAIQAAAGIGSAVTTLTLALLGAGVWSLVLGVIAASFIKLATALWAVGRFVGFSSRLRALEPYFSFSAHLVTQRLIWFWVEQVDQLIVGKLLGSTALGAYFMARNLSHIFLDRTAELVNQVSLPVFAAVQHDPERWHAALRRLVGFAATAGYPVFWGMASIAPLAFPVVLGDKWNQAIMPFMLVCFILPLRLVHSLTGTVMLAVGRADLSLRGVFLWAVVLTPLFFVGARYGVTGVAISWTVGFPIVYALTVWINTRALKMPVSMFLAPMVGPAVAASGCVAGASATYWLGGTSLPTITVLFAQIVVGGLCYLGLLRLAFPAAWNEIEKLVHTLTGLRIGVARMRG